MHLFRTFAIGLVCLTAWAGGGIRLKSRTIDTARENFRPQAMSGGGYLLVQFAQHPGVDTRAELERRGFRILGYVPDAALMVHAPEGADWRNLGVRWAGPLEASDKLSPALAAEMSGAYLVSFHRGMAGRAARSIAAQHGFQVLEVEGVLPWHLLVTGNHLALPALAGHGEVAYIAPAGPVMFSGRRVFGCAGAITEPAPVADYVLADSGWPKDEQGRVALQYVFASMTRKLDSNVARSQVERALGEWSRYTNLTFTPGAQAGAARTIEILFASGAHGDGYPFTSISTLAHTFYPSPPNAEPLAGDMHLNDAETWGVGNSIDLFSVALHEAGHALGLGHSDQPSAVMYPYYKLSGGLASDDIAAIQKLYGVAGTATGTPPATPPVIPPTIPPVVKPDPPGPTRDTTAPTLAILSPAYSIVSTSAASLAMGGTASDNVAVTAVKWTSSTGGSGTAVGTVTWSASVPLLKGTTTITVRAYDAAGNSGWRSVTVVRN
jgi:hypothetical protein